MQIYHITEEDQELAVLILKEVFKVKEKFGFLFFQSSPHIKLPPHLIKMKRKKETAMFLFNPDEKVKDLIGQTIDNFIDSTGWKCDLEKDNLLPANFYHLRHSGHEQKVSLLLRNKRFTEWSIISRCYIIMDILMIHEIDGNEPCILSGPFDRSPITE